MQVIKIDIYILKKNLKIMNDKYFSSIDTIFIGDFTDFGKKEEIIHFNNFLGKHKDNY